MAGYTTIPVTTRTNDEAWVYVSKCDGWYDGLGTHGKGQANQHGIRGAILEMDGPVVTRGDAIIDQAV